MRLNNMIVRKWMDAHDMSQRDVADMLGIHESVISKQLSLELATKQQREMVAEWEQKLKE